jgi:hypothetical protein
MAKPSWTRIKASPKHLKQDELLEVIKVLFDQGDENKTVLARYFDSETSDDLLAPKVKREIDKTFYSERGFPSLKVGSARKALQGYLKVAAPRDAIEMELYYVSKGIQGTLAYGDIDERFYMSIESVFESAIKRILANPEPQQYQRRLEDMAKSTSGIGWGFHDQLNDLLGDYLDYLDEHVFTGN